MFFRATSDFYMSLPRSVVMHFGNIGARSANSGASRLAHARVRWRASVTGRQRRDRDAKAAATAAAAEVVVEVVAAAVAKLLLFTQRYIGAGHSPTRPGQARPHLPIRSGQGKPAGQGGRARRHGKCSRLGNCH